MNICVSIGHGKSAKGGYDIASLTTPCHLKFCVRGVGANITATLTPK